MGWIFRLVMALFFLQPWSAGAESIVVVVNPASGVESLERSDVVNIFLGSFRQFPSGVAATPIDLPPAHPARAEFYRLLVGKTPSEINTYWARLVFSGKTRPPVQVERAEEVVALVQGMASGITYMERSKVGTRLKIVFELPMRE